ncbi:MAG TPA: AI-2E family transporter [Anaerolineae bacterium]|nr:AI-2E family transporter [Anaerolineae bacterium]
MEHEQSRNRTLFFLLTVAVIIYLLEKLGNAALALSNVILLLALAWLLAFTLRPAVEWLNRGIFPQRLIAWVRNRYGNRPAGWFARARLPYGLAVAVVYLLLLAVLLYGILLLVPAVIEQIGQLSQTITNLTEDLPGSFQRVTEWLNNLRETLIRDFNIDPAAIGLPSPEELIRQAGNLVAGLGQFVLALATGIVTFLSQLLLIILISAYIMVDGRTLSAQVIELLPDRFESDVRLLLATIDRTFGGFIRGTLLQAVIYGLAVTALMAGFELQFAVVIGVASGLTMLIPVVGGVIGLILPLLAGLLQTSPNTWLLIVLLFVFQMVLFYLIMPRILSQSLRMPTLLVFIALLAGAQLLGVWGLLFAVPLAAALYSIGVALLQRARDRAGAQAYAPEEPEHLHG